VTAVTGILIVLSV